MIAIFNAETIKGILAIALIILFVSGRGFQMIANFIRRYIDS